MKLSDDFGVRALFGTLIIIGAIGIAAGGIFTGKLDVTMAMQLVNGWVLAVIAFYFGTKVAGIIK